MSNFYDPQRSLFFWNVSLEQFWFVPKKEAVPQSELRRKSIFLPSSPFSHLLFIWRGLSWSSFSLCGGNLFFASFEFRSCLEWIWFAEEWRQPSRTDFRVFFSHHHHHASILEFFYRARSFAEHQIFCDHLKAKALQQLTPMQQVNCFLQGLQEVSWVITANSHNGSCCCSFGFKKFVDQRSL